MQQQQQTRVPGINGHIVRQGKWDLLNRCRELGEIGRDWRPRFSFYNHDGQIFWAYDVDPRGGYSERTVWSKLTYDEQQPLPNKRAFISELALDAASPKNVIVRLDYDGTHYFVVEPKQVVHVLDPNKGPLVFVKRFCPLPWQYFPSERQIRR